MAMKDSVVGELKEILGEENVTTSAADRYVYAFDSGIHRRQPDAVIRPISTEEVRKVVELACRERIPLIPRGAGTALCGHVVPVLGGIIVDLQRMNKIREIRVDGLFSVVEPGVVCDHFNAALGEHGFFIPGPASSEVATLGGMVGANSSGAKALKYGATRDYVLGLTVVTPEADVIFAGAKTPKQSSGYQLEKLYCGSEGTLGIITEIVIQMAPKPAKRAACIAFFDDIEKTGQCVANIIAHGLLPSQLELMSATSIKAVNKATGMGLLECEGILLIEVDGDEQQLGSQIEIIGNVCKKVGVIDIEYTDDEKRIQSLWKARKQMIPSLSILQKEYSTVMLADDMAVPIYNVPKAVAAIEEISSRYDIHIPAYGHAGDGNLHTKVLMDPTKPDHWEQAEKAVTEVYDAILALEGTTSGEHGIGITKAPFFHKERKGAVKVMKAIKRALDPLGIMNPKKIMDWEEGFVTHLRYPTKPLEDKGLHVQKYMDDMVTCTLCGYCKGVCPAFKSLEWDAGAARGKMLMSYGLAAGELDPDQSVADRLFQCVLCGDCARRCPSKLSPPDIVTAARADLVEAGFAYDAHKAVVGNITKSGNIYGEEEFPLPEGEGDMAVFLGCQYGFRMNKTKRYFKILQKLGASPYALNVSCCGFPMKVLGFWKELEEQKKVFEKALDPMPDKIVTFCPSCAHFMKEEYGLNVEFILPVILELMKSADIKTIGNGKKVTWHDPCDLSRRLKQTSEPREILKLLGIEVREMPFSRETSHCCGGGGGILMSDQDMSGDISTARISEAAATGADIIATSCPTCETVLKKSAAKFDERKIVVRDISDLLWQALK